MEVAKGVIQTQVGYHAVAQDRALKDKKMNVLWQMCTNNMQGGPNINQERFPGWRDEENFVIVSDPYPTVSALAADLILPTAMWVEKKELMVTQSAVRNSGINKSKHRVSQNRTCGN